MIKSLLLFSVILLLGSCSVQDNDLDYYTDTQQIKLICQVSVSTEKTDPLYALLLEGKYYKIDDFFKENSFAKVLKKNQKKTQFKKLYLIFDLDVLDFFLEIFSKSYLKY